MKESQLHTVYLGLGSNMGNRREMLGACRYAETIVYTPTLLHSYTPKKLHSYSPKNYTPKLPNS